MTDAVLFVAFPYVAVIVAVLGALYRYIADRYSYSSQSSQFLEGRVLFWGSVLWHYGILSVLLAHLLAAVFPDAWATLLGSQMRLYTLEVTGMALGVLAFLGLGLLILRRLSVSRVRTVTTIMDWVLLTMLLGQVALGLWVAYFYRWGGSWYLHTAAPWLASLVRLDPQIDAVTILPWVVKLHMLGGFAIVAIFPLSLIHI